MPAPARVRRRLRRRDEMPPLAQVAAEALLRLSARRVLRRTRLEPRLRQAQRERQHESRRGRGF